MQRDMTDYTIRKILLPTDFSEVAENAIHTAVAICTRHKAELVLVHVLEDQFALFAPEAVAVPFEENADRRNNVAETLVALAQPLAERFDIVVSTLVLSGDPAENICQWSAVNSIDLIIMGTHGASGLREFFIGSNAYRVVKHAACPVMTIPGTNRWIQFRRILFPVRLIGHALEKYDMIRPIIQRNGSSLIIAGIIKRNDHDGISEMEKLVNIVEKKMNDDEVVCYSEVHHAADIAQHVLHLSEAEKPDLVVITATFEHDHPVRNFFVGPYTQQIVNHCRYPVLSIRGERCDLLTEEIGMVSFA
jgi:nucleotide-binding universal stress UspA family protein